MHKNTGLKRIAKAGIYASQGITAAFRHEAAFRQEVLLALICIPAAFLLAGDSLERAALIGVTVLVMIVELMNSAVEAVVDRIGMELHELSGRAKDMGSGAVLLSLCLWAYVWLDVLVL